MPPPTVFWAPVQSRSYAHTRAGPGRNNRQGRAPRPVFAFGAKPHIFRPALAAIIDKGASKSPRPRAPRPRSGIRDGIHGHDPAPRARAAAPRDADTAAARLVPSCAASHLGILHEKWASALELGAGGGFNHGRHRRGVPVIMVVRSFAARRAGGTGWDGHAPHPISNKNNKSRSR